MRQYEAWWAELPEPIGTRPVVLLSRDAAYAYLNRVLAVEVTTRIRGIPQEVPLGPREGLPQRCVANLDNLRSVPKSVLRERAGRLGSRRVTELKRALGFALGWTELTTLPSRSG
jgi:mRNA interferase MazF